ncbi:acyl-CoA dehydrogenase family protein [Mycobacterium sp. 94-17]|uniref:acyl-CoA dehydrogenase family protein n=1 Tax=Mycobacterium sp. 94-17 TaxID=2986147 RepID=UPI002D1E514E|nr:acyl-CoA dehydrogenase family protein [Mycobacterium sp. 94-17]MEB4209733.1 acyl-CoA dehydrogenase family protein [Mycobacterium sp. 94-17]
MALALTDEQHHLAGAMAGFAARHTSMDQTRATLEAMSAGERPDFWEARVAQGWHAIYLSAEIGGQGGELADAACVMDTAGYALLPGPLLPTVIAGAIVLTAARGSAATAVTTDIARGATAVALLPDASSLSLNSFLTALATATPSE